MTNELNKTSPRQRKIMWRCVLGHKWVGCTCSRCEKIRDRNHDWDHCRCRRCGLLRHSEHDWKDCVCRTCGETKHRWVEGVCTLCGVTCSHEELAGTPAEIVDGLTAHISRSRFCQRCGAKVQR